MLMKRFLASLAAIVALIGGTVSAQGPMDPVAATFDAPSNSPGAGQNLDFVTDQLQHYDMQMFAPLDYNLLDEEPKPSTGVFFTYDRMMSGLTGPESTTLLGQSAPSFNYQTWGNRFEFGYMNENDCGWTATISRLGGSTWLDGRTQGNANPMQLASKLESYELNRVFRQRMKNGGYFEPYIGARFAYLQDETISDRSTLLIGLNDPLIPDINRFQQESQNSMFGGNIGARFFRETGRWKVSSNLNAFMAYNAQFNSASDITFDEDGVVGLVVERGENNETFVPMGEARLDLSYDVTRDISLRVGGHVMYFFEGLTRANSLPQGLNPNGILSGRSPFAPLANVMDQDTASYGVTFGVEWRR